jgi:hypothetical protein
MPASIPANMQTRPLACLPFGMRACIHAGKLAGRQGSFFPVHANFIPGGGSGGGTSGIIGRCCG